MVLDYEIVLFLLPSMMKVTKLKEVKYPCQNRDLRKVLEELKESRAHETDIEMTCNELSESIATSVLEVTVDSKKLSRYDL